MIDLWALAKSESFHRLPLDPAGSIVENATGSIFLSTIARPQSRCSSLCPTSYSVA